MYGFEQNSHMVAHDIETDKFYFFQIRVQFMCGQPNMTPDPGCYQQPPGSKPAFQIVSNVAYSYSNNTTACHMYMGRIQKYEINKFRLVEGLFIPYYVPKTCLVNLCFTGYGRTVAVFHGLHNSGNNGIIEKETPNILSQQNIIL